MSEYTAEHIRTEIMDLVKWILAEAGRSTDVDPAAPLADAGMASVDMVNLMLGVEARFDVTIPREDLTPENFRSVTSVEAMVARLLSVDPLARVA